MRAFVERFKQPSSWAGLSVLWLMVAPQIPFEIVANIGAGVCALISIALNEKGRE